MAPEHSTSPSGHFGCECRVCPGLWLPGEASTAFCPGCVRCVGSGSPTFSANGVNKLISNDQLKMILRASPSGSFTIRQSLSQSMVLFVSGSDGSQGRPGMLGLPFAAKAAQEEAIFFASACASGGHCLYNEEVVSRCSGIVC